MSAALSPIRAAARLAGRVGRVLLHSGRDDDGCGRWSFVACQPSRTVVARGRHIALRGPDGALLARYDGDPLAVLADLVDQHRARWQAAGDLAQQAAGGLACPPVCPSEGGAAAAGAGDAGPVPVAMGYLGYDLGRVLEPRLQARSAAPAQGAADLWFGLYDAVWRHDAVTGESQILGFHEAARAALAHALQSGPDALGPPPRLGPLVPAAGDRGAMYEQRVVRILDYIGAGDVYQVNLARRLVAPVLASGDALAVYAALDAGAPAPFGALLEASDAEGAAVRIISGSPERFLCRPPGSARLETRPIKGTRRRTGDARADAARARELAGDDKERAEHLMIVDLERNDLGRVATIGSVRVEALGYIVELPALFHMVSRVACRLRPDVGLADILRATFPGGSITGAPKLRAMEIIDELEPARRGPYTGSIGYMGLHQAMDVSIAIRTAVMHADQISLHVGGGIVADSRPERELEETEEKAAGWRAALARLQA